MATLITVGIIGGTGKMGRSIVNGFLSSPNSFAVTSFTRESSRGSQANRDLEAKGVKVVGYHLDGTGAHETLVDHLRGVDVLISCMTWEHLEQQIPWIEAAKAAGVKRFVPSEWVGPTPKGVVDIKDKKLDILGAIQRARLPYTIIDVGCWFQVFVPRVPSGRADHAVSEYIDHRIVEDGRQRFALTDMHDIGKYVARIVADPRTLNRHVFAYTEVRSMGEMWDAMARASGEEPPREYVTRAELDQIIESCRERLGASSEPLTHLSNIMDVANFNMGQYRISWCIRGDNTPEYADYLGYLDFWDLFPEFPRGKSLEEFYAEVVGGMLR